MHIGIEQANKNLLTAILTLPKTRDKPNLKLICPSCYGIKSPQAPLCKTCYSKQRTTKLNLILEYLGVEFHTAYYFRGKFCGGINRVYINKQGIKCLLSFDVARDKFLW